jgi:hypothetical protein
MSVIVQIQGRACKVRLVSSFVQINFLRLISNKFYCPSVGTIDDRVVSLVIHK